MKKRILVAPLNWGIGHAARCIPLINKYIEEGHELTLASDGDSRALLLNEFPNIDCHELPSYDVKYPKRDEKMLPVILKQLPKLYKRIRAEKKWLERFLVNNPQDLIISDNRFGIQSNTVHSVIISHQLALRSPVMKDMLSSINLYYLNRFDECWIPDEQDHALSGELSKAALDIPIKFLGPLSRLKPKEEKEKSIPVLAVLSGPEPQRTYFEQELMPILSEIEGAVLVQGKFENQESKQVGMARIISHCNAELLSELIGKSNHVICRSGYSSIMDMVSLNKKAILVPTPLQTEQEYLAKHLSDSPLFKVLHQNDIASELLELLS